MYIMFRLMALIMMLLSMQTAIAAVEKDTAKAQESADVGVAALPPAYPEWSVRAAYVNAVPAPPVGPYMSTGLQRETQGFACCEEDETRQGEVVSLENTPWPMRRRPPQQWQPDNGVYSYAPGEDAAGVSGAKQQGGYQPWPQPMYHPVYQWAPPGGYR